MTATEKLIQTIRQYCSKVQIGPEQINSNGIKYRYDVVECDFKNTPIWLKRLFENAAEENGGRTKTSFYYQSKYSFNFSRSPFKGRPDGKIGFSERIILP